MSQWTVRVQPVAIMTQLLRWLIVLTAFSIPLMFCFRLNDAFELPKQLLLVVAATVIVTIWIWRAILAKEFRWVPSWALAWWALFVVVSIASAAFSVYARSSWLGDHGQEWGSVLTMASVFVVGLVMVQELDERQWRRVLSALIVASGIASSLFLLGLAQIYVLPWKETSTQLFTPVGDVVATAMIAAVSLILASAQFFVIGLEAKHESRLRQFHSMLYSIVLVVIIAVSLGVLAVVGLKPLWVVVLVSELLTYMVIVGRANELAKTNRWVAVFAIVIVALFFLFVPSRWIPQIPPFVFMGWRESVHVVQESVKASPVLGSGPSTFSIDVSKFHSAQALRETFGISFDRARSTPLTQLANLGVAGMLVWLVLMAGYIFRLAVVTLLRKEPSHRWLMLMTITSGWAAALATEAVFPATLTTHVFFWMLTAGMIWVLSPLTPRVVLLEHSHRVRIALVSLCCVLALLIPVVSWGSYQRSRADQAFAHSLGSTGSLDERRIAIREALDRVPSDDVYYRQAGILELAKFQEVASTVKDPEERIRQLRVLARDTIVLARSATQLNSKSVANWQALAGIYQQLSTSVEGAEDEALQSLEQLRAIEPNNPVHFTDTASIYISRGDREQAKGDTANKQVVTNAFIDAEELLQKALVLDPEFAPAHFQSAVIAERRGKLPEAIASVETLSRNRPQDLPLHLQLGALYLKNNQKDLAEKVWNAIVSVKADYANARWYLANLYEEEKRYDDALVQLEEILKTNNDNPQLVKRIEELKNLKAVGGTLPPASLTPKIPLP